MSSPEKSKGLFYAYIVQNTQDSSKWTDNVVAMFADVDVCEEWWKLITGNASKWNSDMNMSADKLKRHSLQWFSWPVTYNTRETMKKIELDPSMESVRGRWSWKVTNTNRDENPPFPPIPLQDDNGWPLKPSQDEGNTALLETLKDISGTLNEMAARQSTGDSGAMVTAGKNWNDGPNWKGGYASYQVVENAYLKAKELKDRGDDRSFAMIFGQLSMEMRRKV